LIEKEIAMDKSHDALALVGRIALVAIFIQSGFGKLANFAGTAGYIASRGLPMPTVLAAITVVVELGLGLAIAVGFKTRISALLIAIWLVPVTLLFHNFWSSPPDQVMMQKIHFMKNVAIFGGMALLIAFGPGRWSLDGGRET
jgi:putative oxidoreductase